MPDVVKMNILKNVAMVVYGTFSLVFLLLAISFVEDGYTVMNLMMCVMSIAMAAIVFFGVVDAYFNPSQFTLQKEQ